jgi:RNA polymerase sigma-70 factor (ECF subfamily)
VTGLLPGKGSSRLYDLAASHQARETELVAAAAKGDQQAFARLVSQYGDKVYGFCCRSVADPHEAEDLTQEVFLKVFRYLPKFQAGRPFQPWLMTIAANTVVSAMRKRKSRPAIADVSAPDSVPLWETALASQAHSEDDETLIIPPEQIEAAIQSLDHPYKQVILLRYYAKMRYDQIAESLQVPLNTVRTWVHRGHQRLRKSLEGYLS